jgi:predicted NUDIX family NTP pyrophosphohydrolase
MFRSTSRGALTAPNVDQMSQVSPSRRRPAGGGARAIEASEAEHARQSDRASLVLEVLLVHPGGPFWSAKDEGAWSIPKGEFSDDEQPLDAAIREFEEETGYRPDGEFLPLQMLIQPGGKRIVAWAVRGDFDPSLLTSNTFTMEWPPKSGRMQQFPEVDRAGWFGVAEARKKILKGQAAFLDQLLEKVEP